MLYECQSKNTTQFSINLFLFDLRYKNLLPNCFHFSFSDTNFSIRFLTKFGSALPHRTQTAALNSSSMMMTYYSLVEKKIANSGVYENYKCFPNKSIKLKRVIVSLAKLHYIVVLCKKY